MRFAVSFLLAFFAPILLHASQESFDAKGKHPQTGEVIEQSYEAVEVLELKSGKVSVIRKYSE